MRTFVHSVRVPYAHTDQMGFVYYANYFVYFEMARSEMLREAGTPYAELEALGVALPVVEASCRYQKPAHFDELLTLTTRCTEIRGPRLRIEYEVTRDGKRLATGHTVHACMSPQGKPIRPPEALKRLAED